MPFADAERSQLAALLEAAIPGRRVEVIGCGMGSYDSYRDSLVLADALRYHPDAIVVLSGNNEYYNPVKLPHPVLYKVQMELGRFWIFRLAQERLGLEPVQPPAPTLEERRANFERNVEAMIAGSRKRGVPLILCTLPANLRDAPPSHTPPPLADPAYVRAWAAYDLGLAGRAATLFLNYVDAHPRQPWGHYWVGRIEDASGHFGRARHEYRQAIDWDNPGNRCHPRINDTIRKLALRDREILADLEHSFSALAPDGIPDGRMFSDQVHWDQQYYPFVSETIVRAIYDFDLKTGAHVLAPIKDWRIAALNAGSGQRRHPVFTADDSRQVAQKTILTAMQAILDDREQGRLMSPAGTALMEDCVRRYPALLRTMLDSESLSQAGLQASVWAVQEARLLPRRWPDVLAGAAEGYRRAGREEQAMRLANDALRLDAANDSARLVLALTETRLGHRALAGADFSQLSAEARADPASGLWKAEQDAR